MSVTVPRRPRRLRSARGGDPAAGGAAAVRPWSSPSAGRRRRASTSSTPPPSAHAPRPARRRVAAPALPPRTWSVDSLAQRGISVPTAGGRPARSPRRAGQRHRDVHGRPRRRHQVRLPARLADADGDGERGHRPHEGWADGRRRLRGSRGSVSLLVVIMLPALLMAAGLVLDGGRQLQVRRDASAAAAAAARAAHAAVRAGDLRRRSRPRPGRRDGPRPSWRTRA